jgi:hypothetical protein
MNGCNVVDQPGVEPIDDISAHKRPGTVASVVPQRPVVSRRQDILTELLGPFDMSGRDPVDEAGEPGIPSYACGAPDTAKL